MAAPSKYMYIMEYNAASKEAQKCFLSSTSITFSNHHPIRNHHRFRRAPAVWGDPAPDYSLAELDPFTNIYLYALLFVDLKMSDHYRRDHTVVKREVMRLAKEANNYFYQINLRLIVVDVLETFRDDLSLYTFELYRNSKMAQLPFHDFAVLISYRYAGGLAFVGGMCNSKSVMLAGFYPHNPEAMASIFFHEVAHLIGVPHRPENETLEVSNCACNNLNTPKQNPQNKKENNERERKLESKSSFISDRRLAAAGCLKIPGFDQDCTLQLMVNLALRTRCLLREPKAEAHTYSLAICGNGVHEEGEECDCGLEEKCNEWNCEPEKCIRRWKPWAVWLLAFILCLIVSGPFLLWLLFPCAVARLSVTYQNWPLNKCRRSYYHFFLPIPPFVGGEENNNNKPVKKTNILACQNGKNIKQKASEQKTEKILLEKNLKNFEIKATRIPLFNWFLASRIRSIWERIKWSICSRILAKRRRKKLKAQMIIGRQSCYIVKRPVKPPPPPPPIFKREISYPPKLSTVQK
ncbi:Peptidase M12B domain-containing protein [Meloidogyne graminicola]|uniref:Peptidase M12B domain-containing protein n=1 Tax=Meloidogyne graminicola TaxID=189291 RepID=A0A8T0A1R1_9BILA|nr:Peptidase M12B domain-containing protein [Meloidogyne graminicola]